MDERYNVINERITNMLKDFVFDKTKNTSIIEQIEEFVDKILNPFIDEHGLVDYWIKSSKEEKPYKHVFTNVGLQYDEFEKAQIVNMNYITVFKTGWEN